MRVVAEKWICDQTPAGARLELPDKDAQALIDLGLARREETPALRTRDLAAEDPAPSPAPKAKPPQYRRRDLKAEGSE